MGVPSKEVLCPRPLLWHLCPGPSRWGAIGACSAWGAAFWCLLMSSGLSRPLGHPGNAGVTHPRLAGFQATPRHAAAVYLNPFPWQSTHGAFYHDDHFQVGHGGTESQFSLPKQQRGQGGVPSHPSLTLSFNAWVLPPCPLKDHVCLR